MIQERITTRRGFIRGAAALGGIALLPGAGWARSPKDFAAPRAVIDRYIAERKIAGGVVALGRAGGGDPDFLSRGTLAMGGGAKMDPDTLFRVYSMTKPITGIAAMLLVEDGRLSIDQPLHEIIPAFREMTVAADPATGGAARPAAKPIRIRHLMTHTAGLTYTIMGDGPVQRLYKENGINPAQWARADEAEQRKIRPATLLAFADAVAAQPLIAEPGTLWHYSIGLDVLGAVIEKVSGTPFDSFLQRRIFDPLGMKDTMFTVPAADLGRFATNYSIAPAGGPSTFLDGPPDSVYATPPSFPYGGAGLVASARDYARFTAMLLAKGAGVMKPETAAIAMSNLLDQGVEGPEGQGFGAGGRVVIKPGGSAHLGQGIGAFGWAGAASTTGWVDPARGIHQVFMTQVMAGPQYPIGSEVGAAVYTDAA